MTDLIAITETTHEGVTYRVGDRLSFVPFTKSEMNYRTARRETVTYEAVETTIAAMYRNTKTGRVSIHWWTTDRTGRRLGYGAGANGQVPTSFVRELKSARGTHHPR